MVSAIGEHSSGGIRLKDIITCFAECHEGILKGEGKRVRRLGPALERMIWESSLREESTSKIST